MPASQWTRLRRSTSGRIRCCRPLSWPPKITALLGACDRDYGCIYMNTLSWRTHTTPMPMEINPRKAFERMFGQGGSAADRALRNQQDRSILDEITSEAGALKVKRGRATSPP